MQVLKYFWSVLAGAMLLLILTVLLSTAFGSFPFDIDIVAAQCTKQGALTSCADKDAIAIGLQLGRLDFASSLLAAVGILIAIVGLLGFWNVKHRSEMIAQAAINDFIENKLDGLIQEEVEARLPTILAELRQGEQVRTDIGEDEDDWGEALDE